ncbi:hypothetical protein GCM10010917_23760 [Paenibacillus physcomitrellae]|uniref:Uncharacterized protein n=1 Tax=Paenibacillus physcomitrellae TaxID=1619311 RepID=A0ABQ1G6Y3_9BACL|nr:hypothetical protein GCM10010917_23760 [Paenibacillus physcomitrellae]
MDRLDKELAISHWKGEMPAKRNRPHPSIGAVYSRTNQKPTDLEVVDCAGSRLQPAPFSIFIIYSQTGIHVSIIPLLRMLNQ